MLQNLSSAAVVIGALRVKSSHQCDEWMNWLSLENYHTHSCYLHDRRTAQSKVTLYLLRWSSVPCACFCGWGNHLLGTDLEAHWQTRQVYTLCPRYFSRLVSMVVESETIKSQHFYHARWSNFSTLFLPFKLIAICLLI